MVTITIKIKISVVVCGLFILWAGSAAAADDQPRIQPYLALNGAEIAPDGITVTIEPDRIRAEFMAPGPGRYSFGLSIEAPSLTPLVPGREPITAEKLTEDLVLRYPYDWTWRGLGNVLNNQPRLVMPGIEVNGKYYIVNTRELCSIQFHRTADGLVRALVLKHRTYNDGGDAAATTLDMKGGEQEHLDILVFASLAEANREWSGTCAPLRGRMTFVISKGWAAKGLSEKEYGRIADELQGIFDYVIVREVAPHEWIPPLFHARGIRVLHYEYLGGLRRGSSQLTNDIEEKVGLTDQDGRRYTAPTSPEGNWLLCDIRREEVRSVFTENARSAVRAGFDGVFLDGPAFWADASGRRGGNVPGATCSLAYARWQLLSEIKSAIRAARPDALLGVLGNQYYDTLGGTDLILKERMYCAWDTLSKKFDERYTMIGQDLDVDYETGQAVYAPNNVVYGVKGYSPISVQSSLHFIRQPGGMIYLETGEFYPQDLEEWLRSVVAIATKDDLYISAIDPPGAAVHFEGRETIWADTQCKATFSLPVCIFQDASTTHAHRVRQFTLSPRCRYRLARECPQGEP